MKQGRSKLGLVSTSHNVDKSTNSLLKDIRSLIESARKGIAQSVNAGLVVLYWSIGQRIRQKILRGERAGYGDKIISTLSRQLTLEYGGGFTDKSLRHMIRFVEVFSSSHIVSTLSRQLGWSHFKEVIYMEDPLKRDFYAEMCRAEGWSVRTLRQKIGSMLYERTALSKKPKKLIELELKKLREEDKLTPDLVFRDPYILDFLKLKNSYQEKDLEVAILREMESFILEIGVGFSFIARQKRIQMGPDDFYLDLLFYHRKLHRLVAIELKLDHFKPKHKGQMEFYLRYLAKYEREPGEKPPLGIILCATKSEEQIKLLELEKSGIHVASYLTQLPPRELLEKKLHEAVRYARNKFTN